MRTKINRRYRGALPATRLRRGRFVSTQACNPPRGDYLQMRAGPAAVQPGVVLSQVKPEPPSGGDFLLPEDGWPINHSSKPTLSKMIARPISILHRGAPTRASSASGRPATMPTFGSSVPVAPNRRHGGRAKSRCIEVTLIGPGNQHGFGTNPAMKTTP